MNIHFQNQNMLVLIEQNKLHAAVCWVVMAIGLIGMVAVPLFKLPIYSIVVPLGVLLVGTIAWRFSGLPLLVVADKTRNELLVKVPPQFGTKYENNKYLLDQVHSIQLVESTQSGAVKRGEALPDTYAVFVGFKNGKFIPVCHYHHKYDYRSKAHIALVDFVGLAAAPVAENQEQAAQASG